MGTKFRGTVSKITFVEKQYLKELRENVRLETRKAARLWLEAVLERVPTYTGTARGTFRRLGKQVKPELIVSKGKPLSKRPIKEIRKKKFFKYNGKTFRLGFTQGEQYSKSRFYDAEKSRYFFKHNFDHDNELLYFVWNDESKAPDWFPIISKTPWEAVKAGNEAFSIYIKSIPFPGPPIEFKPTRIR